MALFQSARNAPARFGCFGKLPSYADFMSLNVDGPETQALAAWLQDGVGAAPGAASAEPEQFVHFAWRPESAKRTLVGVMWQSADAAGRRFPFTIFTSFAQQQIAAQGALAVLSAASVRTRIHELYKTVVRSPRTRDQYVAINEAPVPPVPDPAEVRRVFVDRAEAATLRRDEAPAFAGHAVALARLAERLLTAPELPDFALRMHLLGSDPDVELATWTQILCDRLGSPEIDATYFLRFTRAGPSAFLFHRELAPADLSFVLAPSDEYRGAESVGFHPNGGGPARTRLTESLQRAWSQRPATYRSLVDLVALAPVGDMNEAEAPTTFAGAAPAQAPVTAPTPASPPPPPAPSAAQEEATGPIVLEGVTDGGVTGPAAEAPSAEAAAEPTTKAEVAPAEESKDPAEDTAQAVELSLADLSARIERLAEGTLLPGRLVRAAGAAAASSADTVETAETIQTGETVETAETAKPGREGARTLLLYLEDAGYAALLQGLDAEALQRVEAQIADCADARGLLKDLAARHRQIEERLSQAVLAACARAPRPGQPG